MIITLEEMKQYLRVDFDDDDFLIETLITSATRLCMDITRQDQDAFEESENAKPAIYYAVAYLYEHREVADHHWEFDGIYADDGISGTNTKKT